MINKEKLLMLLHSEKTEQILFDAIVAQLCPCGFGIKAKHDGTCNVRLHECRECWEEFLLEEEKCPLCDGKGYYDSGNDCGTTSYRVKCNCGGK